MGKHKGEGGRGGDGEVRAVSEWALTQDSLLRKLFFYGNQAVVFSEPPPTQQTSQPDVGHAQAHRLNRKEAQHIGW